jgi:iron complex outermembrane receptor protein
VQPDGRLINVPFTFGTVPASAFGTAGVTNCAANFITGWNGGSSAVPPGLGYNCGGVQNRVLYGATYDPVKFRKTTGRLAVDYKLSEDKLLYVSYSTGFHSGGFNSGQALATVRSFLPEEVNAIEMGSKNRFLGNTLQLNVSAFFNKYKNLQEQRQIPFGATTISTTFNAAKAESKGVEFEAEWAASESLDLGGTLSLLDAKYTEFPDVALPFGTSILVVDATQTAATVVNGVTIAPAGQRRVFAPGYNCRLVPGTGGTGQPGAAFGCDLSGNYIPYSPRYSGALYGSYDFHLAGGSIIRPLLVLTYSGDFYGQSANSVLEKQPAFTKLDFKLSWQANQHLSAQVYADNLTDRQTLNRFVWGGGGALQVSAAPPRMIGIRVTYKN